MDIKLSSTLCIDNNLIQVLLRAIPLRSASHFSRLVAIFSKDGLSIDTQCGYMLHLFTMHFVACLTNQGGEYEPLIQEVTRLTQKNDEKYNLAEHTSLRKLIELSSIH